MLLKETQSNPVLQYYSTTAPQHHSTTVLQHHSTAVLQYYSTTQELTLRGCSMMVRGAEIVRSAMSDQLCLSDTHLCGVGDVFYKTSDGTSDSLQQYLRLCN